MAKFGFFAEGLLIAFLSTSCGATNAYTPKRRDYQVPEVQKTESRAAPGSLWEEGRPGTMLFTDARALRANDLVVVKIEEVADAKRAADTDLKRSSQASVKINEFLGLMAKLKTTMPWIDPQVSAETLSEFSGKGSTGRTERLTATVPALVRKVLPNGNLFVEGHRAVLVNNEEHHFYISGVVRPIDIDQENSVKSSMIADAEIEFTGRGVLSENQEKGGWASRYLGWLWPF